MKYITDPEHFFEVVIKEPYTLFIYSSVKMCPPCRALKKWIETEQADTPHLYYIDMDKAELESLTTHIYAMPTLQLHHHSTVIDTIEGFNKSLIQKAIDTIKANSVSEPEQGSETVSQSESKHEPVSVLKQDDFEPVIENKELNLEGTSVDSILSQLQKNLDTY
jgi:hypothetical protein